uniref:Uncharacterized protein n=1 Tax=viral metagenome TaxID=1070528 RepID=A0A6C0L953_9ZZZZ
MVFYLVIISSIVWVNAYEMFKVDETTMMHLIVSKKVNDRYIGKEYDKTLKCEYINHVIPYEPFTCSKSPEDDYRNIYQKTYKTQLWEYQSKECFPDIEPSSAIMSLSVIFVLFMICLDPWSKQ